MRWMLFALMFALAAVPLVGASTISENNWMIGVWRMVADEDKGPLGETFELRANGTYVTLDRACSPRDTLEFHVHRGDIYVTNVIQGKGPVSIVFRPSQDRARLTYTSPRTARNAIYERLPGNKCVNR